MDGRISLREKQRDLVAVQIMNRFKSSTVERKKKGKYAKSVLEHLHNTDALLCGFGSWKDWARALRLQMRSIAHLNLGAHLD